MLIHSHLRAVHVTVGALSTLRLLMGNCATFSVGRGKPGLFRVGQGGLNSELLDRLNVLAAHIAGAFVFCRDEIVKSMREELADDLVVGHGATFEAQLEPLYLALRTLQVSHYRVGTGDGGALQSALDIGEFRLSAGQLES